MSEQQTQGVIAIEAGLWFSYGKARRPEVSAKTTFDAVLRGERSSTTRFLRWPGHPAWAAIQPGQLVRFHEDREHRRRNLVVRVVAVQPIDLRTCDAETLDAWSKAEGWTAERGRELGIENGPALWLRHDLVWPALEAATPQARQLALF